MSEKSVKMPSGIPFIIGNETAERFSYYGMKTILVVFMTDYLRMSDNMATDWIHMFGAAVYAFPILGALLADMLWGKYKTILSLSIVYCLGHLVLAIREDQMGLAIGLTLIAIGSGGIKPCVSAHVGDQFNSENKHLLSKVFSYFYLAINVGSLVSTLLTPILLEYYGPAVAFGIPGLLMFIATILFWMGRHKFVHIPAFGKDFVKVLFTKEGLAATGKLVLVYFFIAVFWALYDQTGSTWVIQAKSVFVDKHISLFGLNFDLLPSQIQVFNPLFVLILVPLFNAYIYPWLSNFMSMKPMNRITMGMFVTSLSFIVIGWIESHVYVGLTTHVMWQVLAYAFLIIAEVMIYATALEFSYTQAPNQMKSFIMGLFLLSISFGNVITVAINHWLVSPAAIENIVSGEKTYLIFKNIDHISEGDKIGFQENNNVLEIDKEGKETFLSGTYLIGKVVPKLRKAELWNINRESVATKGEFVASKKDADLISLYKLNGSAYFYFYAIIMVFTAIIFIAVANNFKEKEYIQES